MRTMWIRILAVLAILVGGVAADELQSEKARGILEKLVMHHREEDYRALENWVFAPGLEDEVRRSRVEDGVWVVAGKDGRFAFHDENQVWADGFLARLEKEAGDRWWAWLAAGKMLGKLNGRGVLEKGVFVRGRGWEMNSRARDKARMLQSFLKVMEMAQDPADRSEAELMLAKSLHGSPAELVTKLTDLRVLPEISESTSGWSSKEDQYLVDGHSPVIGADGEWRLPVLRARFEDAQNDGERIYWLLNDAARISPKHAAGPKLALAEMWHKLLGVDHLAELGYVYLEGTKSADDLQAKGEFDLHTLRDDETILIGKKGPERRLLPAEAHYLGMLRELVADAKTKDEMREDALRDLLPWLADRYQYDAAEEVAKLAQVRNREGEADFFLKSIAPDGEFIQSTPTVAGREVEVEFVSRGLTKQRFELWELDVEKYVAENGTKMLGTWHWGPWSGRPKDFDQYRPFFRQVTTWVAPLEKRANHMQSRNRVKVPVKRAGAYLVVARIGEGYQVLPVRVVRTILLNAGSMGASRSGDEPSGEDRDGDLFLIDAISGEPVEGAAAVEVRNDREGKSRRKVITDHAGSLLGMEGDDGVLVRRKGMPAELLEAYSYGLNVEEGEGIRSFLVTSQPLYRPGQTVDYAGWLRRPNWRGSTPGDMEEDAMVRVKVTDPVGQVIHETELPLDEFDGFVGSFSLAEEMVLGDCKVELSVGIPQSKNSSDPFEEEAPKEIKEWESTNDWTIKVAEFRKPDFQVELEAGPQGGDFTATVRANYHSSEPVKGAAVKANLRAYPGWEPTFPEKQWEWLYFGGYDWPLPTSAEVGGWEKWGVRSEYDGVMSDEDYGEAKDIEVTGVTDQDGRARLVFPKKNLPLLGIREYYCRVRVLVQEFTGRSVGAESGFQYSGRDYEVLAQPEKGFYRAAEPVKVKVWTMAADRSAVTGEGKFTVEAIREGGKFEAVAAMDFVTGENGVSELEFVPPGAGRYRCIAAAGGGQRGFVLEVIGEGLAGYQGVRLIPSKAVGQEGEEIEVLITSENEKALVWLFEQMPDGLRRTPRMIRTKGHTAIVRIPLTTAGSPNFFLHAVTVEDGRVEQDSCRIVIPPEESVLDVAMSARPEKGEPGGRAEVEIGVKDARGKPAMASLAVTAFDEALEDLGGRWPDAGDKMLDSFEDTNPLSSSLDRGRHWVEPAFQELHQPGVFFERTGMVGKPPWRAEGQFVEPGSQLWVQYEPPELPNSVGPSDSFDSFPVTPATPSIFARDPGREVEMSAGEKAAMAGVDLRKKFTDRAYWGAALKTDAGGKVRAEFDFPANLTKWRVRAWAFGKGRSYGNGEVDVAVSKRLQVRPLLPQAAVAGDELEVGAMVQNLSNQAHEFQVTMAVDGVEGSARSVMLAAGGEGRVVWQQTIARAGTVDFHFRARSVDGSLTDGVESRLAVAPRLTPVTLSTAAEIRGGEREIRLELKPDEPVGKTQVRVRVEAHPAVSALAVLPDLVGYPYGCTEQTLNRFLPTLVAWKAAGDLGIDWQAMTQTLIKDETSLGWVKGRAAVSERPTDLNERKVRSMILAGLGRLKEKQRTDGSWGWFSAEDQEGSAYMTALAVRGIATARKLGFKLNTDPAVNGVSWLQNWATRRVAKIGKEPADAGPLDAWVVYVLQEADEKGAPDLKGTLLKVADKLPPSGLLHLALSMDPEMEAAEMKRLRGMAEVAMKEETNWRWEWWREPTELRAWHLKLLVKMGAGKEELERGIGDLLKLRTDGIRWSSTKTSGLCVEAIVQAAIACGGSDLAGGRVIPVEVETGGLRQSVELDRKNLWTAHFALLVEAASGEPVWIGVKAGGERPVMAMASMEFRSAAPARMQALKEGLAVERRYFRLAADGTRKLLTEGEKVAVGELIEVELKVVAEGDRPYVHLRDPIPAGLEPLIQLSGYEGGAYRESRAGETDFFFSGLSRWNSVQRYQLRAVTKGSATALSARAECMYAPEISGHSGLRVIEVE